MGHSLAMAFGLAGLLWVLPHPDFILALPPIGQTAFQWSMSGGGVVYILLGAIAISIYAHRTLGMRGWLTFLVPSVMLSLASELLGTSTGFPFGHYAYLSGLGYKIAGLVPFTIPLSWFYLGFVCYLLARVGLAGYTLRPVVQFLGAILLGAVLLTAWDLVLDPAMSQSPFPFWEFHEVGEFFGMPYRNLTGWLGTGVIFMSIAGLLWGKLPIGLPRSQMLTPLVTYLVNFGFGATITLTQLDQRFWVPTGLGILLGVIPALLLYGLAKPSVEGSVPQPSVSESMETVNLINAPTPPFP
jgi:putative membrane protein